MKEGNECPRSVKFCLQRQRLKNPQQDQNQLNGNERVPVVCVRNLWKSDWKLRTWIGTSKWFAKSLQNTEQSTACQKGCQQVQGPASLMPSDIWSLQNSCEIYDLRWPHRHLFDCDSITSSGESCEGSISCIFLLYTNLPTCSAGLVQALSNVNPLIILEGVWQCLRWQIIRAVATSVVAPGLFRESGPAMWATTVLDGLE